MRGARRAGHGAAARLALRRRTGVCTPPRGKPATAPVTAAEVSVTVAATRACVAGGFENAQDADESDDALPSAAEATIRGLLNALRNQAAAAGVAAAERELSEGLRLDNDALRQLVNERSLELRCAHAGMGTNTDAASDASLILSLEQQPDKQNQSNGDTSPAASLDSLAQSQLRVMLDVSISSAAVVIVMSGVCDSLLQYDTE